MFYIQIVVAILICFHVHRMTNVFILTIIALLEDQIPHILFAIALAVV